MSRVRRRRLARHSVRAAYLALVLAAFALGFGLGRGSGHEGRGSGHEGRGSGHYEAADGDDRVPSPAPSPARHETVVAPVDPGRPVGTGLRGSRVALVIDDLGRSVATVDDLGSLGVPMSYAVLPFESRTAEVVDHLAAAGMETLCHLPMEALGGVDAGPGALLRSMSADEIRTAANRALTEVPGAVGVNNHMGSAFSQDDAAMVPFLEVVADRGLFFLDSRTSPATRGLELATRLGVAVVERNVFLDRDRSPDRIRAEFRRALDLASARPTTAAPATTVIIGHPYPETIAILREEIPRALDLGVTFVTVGDVAAGR